MQGCFSEGGDRGCFHETFAVADSANCHSNRLHNLQRQTRWIGNDNHSYNGVAQHDRLRGGHRNNHDDRAVGFDHDRAHIALPS